MERFAKILEEYDGAIEKIRQELTKKHKEDMRKLDVQKSQLREMLQQTVSSEMAPSSPNHQQTANTSASTIQPKKVTLEARISEKGTNSSNSHEGISQNADEIMSNGSSSSSKKRKLAKTSVSDKTINGNEDSNRDNSKKVTSLKISTKYISNSTNNTPTEGSSKTVSTASATQEAPSHRQQTLPPVKFKILRDSSTSNVNYEHAAHNSKEKSKEPKKSTNSYVKEEEEEDFNEYEVVDEADNAGNHESDWPFDGDSLMEDGNYIEDSNLELPEPYNEEDEFELPEFSSLDHSSGFRNVRVKLELSEEESSDKVPCIFCKKTFQKCGITRHSERCWKLHGGQSKKWIYCLYPGCNYGTMKSKYSNIYTRNHIKSKHNIPSDSEADKYIRCRVLRA